MDEQELILRVRDGDEEAFARIMEIYKDRIVNYLYQFTRDYQRAVDLSQETFLRVYFKADKYKPIAPLSSWIYAIASNLAKTDARKAPADGHRLARRPPEQLLSRHLFRGPAGPGARPEPPGGPRRAPSRATGSPSSSRTWRASPRRRSPGSSSGRSGRSRPGSAGGGSI